MIKERVLSAPSGVLALLILIPVMGFLVFMFVRGVMAENAVVLIGSVLAFVLDVFLIAGIFIVNPNEGRILQLFGRYTGTVKESGLRWANPFLSKGRISLRIRNFESDRIKVNDTEGNPIEIAAVVVWKVVDTAEATFEVDSYKNYVHVQTEAAVRNLATNYPYDTHETNRLSLRGNTSEIAEHLKKEIQARLDKAGVDVIEARISHLAYAPEIASVMLQRQQAGAIIAARTRIVEGAVGMVEMALEKLSSQNIIELDEERKAAMVSNLLVVLCGDKAVHPVVNAGTLYQ